MKLTAYSNYALRCLQFAALRDPEIVRIDEVARAHQIRKTHLNKVIFELGRAGYLQTLRGRGGGFRLGRPAADIYVNDVLAITEGPLNLVECFEPATSTCPLTGICHLSKKLQEATQAFSAVLADLTIADIAGNRSALTTRLDKALAP